DAKTKSARAAKARSRKLAKEGVLTPEEVGSLLAAAATGEGLESSVALMLAVECGLRRGELVALSWGDVAFGKDEYDETGRLLVRSSRPQGGEREETKSGKQREPHISARLRLALLGLRDERKTPSKEDQNKKEDPSATEPIVQVNYWALDDLLARVLKR